MRSLFRAPAFLALILSGCGHMPVSTMWALRNFDASTADPAMLRAAVRLPEGVEPRPGGVTFKIGWWREGEEAKKRSLEFVLRETNAPSEIASLADHQKPGARIFVYRVAPADVAGIRAVQAEILSEKQKRGANAHGTFGIGAEGCRRGDLPTGPLYATTFLKTDEERGYLTLLKDVDLRTLAAKNSGEADALPPCEKFVARAGSPDSGR